MKNNRRNFLKISGVAGLGLLGTNLSNGCTTNPDSKKNKMAKSRKQMFNMSGFAASAMKTVRVGFIGLGNRGPTHLTGLSKLEGVDIKALCDLRPDKVLEAKKLLQGLPHNPEVYTGSEDVWKDLCKRDDIDLVYIATPWHLHTPMAVYAMNQGKHVCVEVPAALTLEECWSLVETSERTRKHCMMLENCCYGFYELLTLNMARQGFFGEIIHCEGDYIHDLVAGNFAKDKYYDMWRLRQNASRNGNLYPTHGIGPICQIMGINRGDKMEYLVSVSSNDFIMGKVAKSLASKDDFYSPFVGKSYRGNMNTTTIRTNMGRTIMLQHDVTSSRPRPGNYMISGTKAIAHEDQMFIAPEFPALTPGIWKTSSNHEWILPGEYEALKEKFTPNIVKKIGEIAKEIGGHGGMDFLIDWRTIDCLRNGLPLDQDVYDAALWSSIAPLSEWSVANRSNSIDVPDFTCGSWETNKPVDISLETGGNTKITV